MFVEGKIPWKLAFQSLLEISSIWKHCETFTDSDKTSFENFVGTVGAWTGWKIGDLVLECNCKSYLSYSDAESIYSLTWIS